jgi:RNA polymerase sigma-70 factor (ECF subfamily)
VSSSVLQRVAAGEQQAIAECIDLFGGLVWHLARRTLPVRADLDDAVQEVFVELWKAAPKYDPAIASERAFVAVIARRRLIDRARRERVRIASTVNASGVEFEPIGRGPGTLGSAGFDGRPTDAPATPVERSEEAALAAAAMRELSHEQQKALRLSLYEGLSHQEIADRLGVPLGTVKTNLRRGLIRIREMLSRTRAAAEDSRLA